MEGLARARPSRRRPPRRGPAARPRPGSTSGRARRRTGPSARAAARSPRCPRYGLTVTASAPEAIEQGHGLAGRGRADVAALRVGDEREVVRQRGPDPLEGRDAGRAERLEEREVGFDGRGVRACGLDEQRRRTPRHRATSGENPAGSPAGSGSIPRHRTLPTAADRAASRSRKPPGHGAPLDAASRARGTPRPRRSAPGVGAGSWSGGTNQPGRDAPSSPDTSVKGDRVAPPSSRAPCPSESGHLEVDDLALDVEERDRIARRATRRAPTTRRRS